MVVLRFRGLHNAEGKEVRYEKGPKGTADPRFCGGYYSSHCIACDGMA